MIPNIIHFIFGLEKNFGGIDFSFIHFLAVYTAWKVNKPEKIYFHYGFEPTGEWWEKAKPYLLLNKITPPTEIFGNPLKHYAHKSDVVRLEMLSRYGGIYLDMDVLCINPLKLLLNKDFVMGIEHRLGLCNAVILANSNSKFLSLWYREYKNFDGNVWAYHSVKLPLFLSRKHRSLIHIEDRYSFFYPTYREPAHLYLWYPSIPFRKRIKELMKNTERFLKRGLHKEKTKYDYSFHAIHGRKWHYNKLCKSYCIHLCETLWWDEYLKELTPDTIIDGTSNFSMLIKKIITREELLAMRSSEQTVAADAHHKLTPAASA